MASLASLPSEILDNIIHRLPHTDKIAIRQVSHRFLQFIPPRVTVKIQQLNTSLHTTVSFVDGPLSSDLHSQFLSHHEHSVRSSMKKDKDTGVLTSFRTFEFPPTSDFSFFESAKIDHLAMHEVASMPLTDENLTHLTNLLAGCTINKISLVFEERTISILPKLPKLLAKVRAKHMDFILVRIPHTDLLSSVLNGELASKLVNIGVREVTFSGEQIRTRTSPVTREDLHDYTFNLISSFFAAGIDRITVNPGPFFSKDLKRNHVLEFIRKLGRIEKSMRLQMYVTSDDGRLTGSGYFEMHGLAVCVSEVQRKHRLRTDFTLISVEGKGRATESIGLYDLI